MKFANLFLTLVIVILGTQFARAELWPEIDLFKLEITGCKDAKFGKIAALDDYLFVTSAEGALGRIFVLKVSGYGSADLVASSRELPQLKNVTDINVSGQNPIYVYLICDSDVLWIFRFDPNSGYLNSVRYYDLLYHPVSISVRDSYAYIIDHGFLRVLDISDPTKLHEVGQYSPGDDRACDLFLSDSYAFVAVDFGLRIVHLHDINELGRFDLPRIIDGVSNVFVSGSYAFLGYSGPMLGDGTIAILDISDISNPNRVSTVWVHSPHPSDIAISGAYLFTLDGSELIVWDISKLPETRVIGYCFPHRYNICVSGNYVYLSGSYRNDSGEIWGLDVASLPEPAAVTTTTWGKLKALFK